MTSDHQREYRSALWAENLEGACVFVGLFPRLSNARCLQHGRRLNNVDKRAENSRSMLRLATGIYFPHACLHNCYLLPRVVLLFA